ncbi:MAG: winged helix-turn-helix domain-containing protein [Candidatus Uhrbacteria bacterium]
MNKFKHSAIEVLKVEKKPLHYKEITRLALERGLLETEGATPDSSMNSQIITDIKHKGENSDFIKTSPSTYGLNPNHKTEPKKIIEEIKEIEEEEKRKVESGYVGKGGEFLVCSELLFRGYNASIMSVDVGMDIIATKESKLFGIQVKTSNLNQYNTYNFDVRKVSFERHDSGGVYYIFVLRSENSSQFLILPYSEMAKKVHEKAIKVVVGDKYRLKIDIRDGKVYLGNREHEMGYYLNNWEVIK